MPPLYKQGFKSKPVVWSNKAPPPTTWWRIELMVGSEKNGKKMVEERRTETETALQQMPKPTVSNAFGLGERLWLEG
ncbi:hypothetical protein AKJ64_01365 [candidate division MSBL1 archaeon SCGC-AAA259E17]|uniref:Uncharacterized protein n=1 Tax=candidate division MSBL1 archaeon SCGC-AAA259E17 TaxID=1698263 RepID=A0A133UG68_9EURY|nr:hypothetical protein AKJ64_01365 [candidate division MSBL1 archaeon SCGC-AAA259E17]